MGDKSKSKIGSGFFKAVVLQFIVVSIKEFVRDYQPGEELFVMASKRQRQERDNGHPGSIITALGLIYIEEGAKGVMEFSDKYNLSDERVATLPTPAFFNRFPANEREQLFMDYGAVMLGASIVTIENLLINGNLDMNLLLSTFNEPLRKSPFSSIDISGEKKAILSLEAVRALRQLANTDKTFSIFFSHDGLQAMPKLFRDFLSGFQFSGYLVALLPAYKRQADFLITTQAAMQKT